jgi:hypothetical protein
MLIEKVFLFLFPGLKFASVTLIFTTNNTIMTYDVASDMENSPDGKRNRYLGEMRNAHTSLFVKSEENG